ncbi:MAG: hypothetical protein IJ413_06040 [Bacteroides sp.]|nr:hypothetical protein [Bacteroides sp.]
MRKFYLGIALAMAMASCTHEEMVNSMSESRLNVTVESVNEHSRVGFEKDEDWSFFWHNGDKIWVNEGIMSTNDADKSKTATFTGYGVNTSSGYAVYPYAMAEDNVNGSQLTWNFPSTYTYDDVDADFFTSAQGIPMYAKVKDGKASFKHLGAIVAFKFNDWEFTGEHIFTLTSSKKISGAFTADLSGETPAFATTTDGEDMVTVTYNRPTNTNETSIVLYVPIPTGTYDLKVKVTVDDVTKFTKKSSNKTVNRGDIVWAEIGESVLVGDNKDVKEVTSVDQINDQVLSTTKDDLTVQVTGEVTGSQTIEIPASLDTKTTTFMFENVADDAVITINNETGGAYDGKVIIEVPVGETIPTVNANVPNGEVYIKQGTVTTLVVSSKKNTTIIGTGVKVEKLSVNQGNVRVEKDSKISAIENNTNGTLYITNAGGTLPVTLPDNTIVVYEDTEHAVVLNDKYSTDNITELMSYGKDVLNTNELSFTLSAGQYEEVVKVTGGKNITFEPKTVSQEVSIAGLDHQSNGTPSTVIVKNITLDNTLQTEGWFTGTAQNIKPCVGAWGGNFTFDGCKFIVEGTSGKETGVMTWWIVNKMSLTFNDCTFEGKDNHASARAMQIYGDADLTVTNCTFNTYKDYSLKYVAKEGNVATFEGNKIYNSQNFVQLGSAQYAGSKYTVNLNNTTLGDGINLYYIDNDEDQKVYIDGSLVVSTDAQLLSALTDATASDIKILLGADLNLPQDKDVSAANVIIDGNNHSIQITSHYHNLFADFTNSNAKLVLKNLKVKGAKTKTTDGSPISTTWDLYDIRFNCDVEMTDVDFDQCVCIANGADAVLNNVNITENTNSGLYAMWIEAKGSTVTINGGKIDNANGRGIKIDEQYIESTGGTVKKTVLNATDTKFITNAKAAIMVKSKAGAEINLKDINIEKVEADNVNAVWCDEDAAEYNDLITVKGGSKIVEGQ